MNTVVKAAQARWEERVLDARCAPHDPPPGQSFYSVWSHGHK